MKEFTAEEARALAGNCKVIDKTVKKILRKIRKRAKQGGYAWSCSTLYDSVIDKHICEKLESLGYDVNYSCITGTIKIFWNGKGEE